MLTNHNQRLTLVNIGSFTNQDVNVYMVYKSTDALYDDFQHNGCYLDAWISLFKEIARLMDTLTHIYDVVVREWTREGIIHDCDRHDRRVYERIVCNHDITRNNKYGHFHVEPYCDRGGGFWFQCGDVASVPHTPYKIWIDMVNGDVDLGGLGMFAYPEHISAEFANSYNPVYKSRYNWDYIKFADFRSVLHEMTLMRSRVVDKNRAQYITFRDGCCVYVNEFFD